MDTEAGFQLIAVVGQSIAKPNVWHATGYIHAPGEVVALETIYAGGEFESREVANLAGIEAARCLAKTLRSGDSRANREKVSG